MGKVIMANQSNDISPEKKCHRKQGGRKLYTFC